MAAKAFICGCAGPRLEPDEAAFLADERPFGLILFRRNCREPSEISDLAAAFREAVGRSDAPVLVDQEGGRVQRLGPPRWPAYPPARVFGALADVDLAAAKRAAWLSGRSIAADLTEAGIDVDCAPVLDVLAPGASDVIGDRSFGSDPKLVAALGRAFADGLLNGGVVPVVKHLPGHGRAALDSHLALPSVDAELDALDATDFAPFRELADLPMAMTAHVIYTAVDRRRPATTSPAVIRDIIRGRIGFTGLLMSDDVSMNALSGDFRGRAAASYAAGCDIVLHCNARTQEMRAVASAAPELAGVAGERARRALRCRQTPKPFDREGGRAELIATLARVGWPEAVS